MGLVVTALVLAPIALLIIVRNWPEKGTPVGEVATTPVAPEDVVVAVSGWSDAELQTILSDFGKLYDLPEESLRALSRDGAAQVRVAHPIDAVVLVFLVNYLHYPKSLNPNGREVAAIATVRRSDLLGGPGELADRRATVYVPADDAEFDEVFVRVDPARYFRISFSRMKWRAVDSGREPTSVRHLMGRILGWTDTTDRVPPDGAWHRERIFPNA